MRESVGGDEREKAKMIVEKQIPDMDMTENSKTRFFCLSIFSYNIIITETIVDRDGMLLQ